jgi:hypothetical protein
MKQALEVLPQTAARSMQQRLHTLTEGATFPWLPHINDAQYAHIARRRATSRQEHRPVRAERNGLRIFVGGGVSYLAKNRHAVLSDSNPHPACFFPRSAIIKIQI